MAKKVAKKSVKKTQAKKQAQKKVSRGNEPLDIKTGFMFPFNRPKGMLNILWILLPIIGWFALGGYIIRIINGFTKGDFGELPTMQFGSDFKHGFFMFLKFIPFLLVYMLFLIVIAGILGVLFMPEVILELVDFFMSAFILPILIMNFIRKETVGSLFEFSLIPLVFRHLGDYLMTLLKTIVLGVVFLVMIVIVVGIPGLAFTHNMFLADFYRRRVK